MKKGVWKRPQVEGTLIKPLGYGRPTVWGRVIEAQRNTNKNKATVKENPGETGVGMNVIGRKWYTHIHRERKKMD